MFEVYARRNIAPGEEVTISYGDLSNAKLLDRYGFELPKNPNLDDEGESAPRGGWGTV